MKNVLLGLAIIGLSIAGFRYLHPNPFFSHTTGEPQRWVDLDMDDPSYRSNGYSTVTGEKLTTITKELGIRYASRSSGFFTPKLEKPEWKLTVNNNDELNPAIIQSTVNITDEVIRLTQKCGVRYNLTFQRTPVTVPPRSAESDSTTFENWYYGTWSKGTLDGEIALAATNDDGTHFEGYWWNSNSNKEENRFAHRVILELK